MTRPETENAPSSTASPQGRRVLVAVVDGEAGERIQAWRMAHDPVQARRLPPHTTLCYWAPAVEPATLERQVRHAFDREVCAWLGEVREFDNDQHTFFVEVRDTGALDAARERLYDGAHIELPGGGSWQWHVTCVRESIGRDLAELRRAATELTINAPWRIAQVAYLELRGETYERLATWRL